MTDRTPRAGRRAALVTLATALAAPAAAIAAPAARWPQPRLPRRDDGPQPPAPGDDAPLIADCARVAELHRAMEHLSDNYPPELHGLRFDHPKVLAREALVETLITEFDDILEAIASRPPATIAALVAKAIALQCAMERNALISTETDFEAQGESHERLAWQFARDVQRAMADSRQAIVNAL